jgi:hypothetical protein
VPPEGPARGWGLAGRVGEGVSEFVGDTRMAEDEGYFACRASLTLAQAAHAIRVPLIATAHATAHPCRAPRPVFRAFPNFPTSPS